EPDDAHMTMRLRAAQSGSGPQAQLALHLEDVALPQWNLALRSLTLSGRLAFRGTSLALALDDCAKAEGLAVARIIAEVLPVCPGTDGAPALALSRADGGHDAFALNVVLRDARMRYVSRTGTALVTGVWPVIGLSGAADAVFSSYDGQLTAEGGDLRLGGVLA